VTIELVKEANILKFMFLLGSSPLPLAESGARIAKLLFCYSKSKLGDSIAFFSYRNAAFPELFIVHLFISIWFEPKAFNS